jgi:hypothetical protein
VSDTFLVSAEKAWPWLGALLGALVTPLALFVAMISAGAGHGDYLAARLLYPVPMLLTWITGDTITNISLALAFAQFPVYGYLVGRFRPAGLFVVAVAHGIPAGPCFCGMLPNFS